MDESASVIVSTEIRINLWNLEKFSSYKGKKNFFFFFPPVTWAVLDNLAHRFKSLCWDYICTTQLPGVERINAH